MRDMYSKGLQICADSVNDAVGLFNMKLKAVVDNLNTKLNAANFTYINIFDIQFGYLQYNSK